MQRIIVTALIIAWLRSPAGADPTHDETPPHDRDGAGRASVARAGETPWLDLAPALKLKTTQEDSEHGHPIAAAATLAGLYAGFTTWTYFAWYHNKVRNSDRMCHGMPCPSFKWGGDRWFQADTYAGGADKLGHAWATMGLARGGTEMLHQWGGYSRLTSSIIGCGLAELLFFGVEVKDGAYYEFSFSDFTFNSIGAVLAFAMSNWPRLDELLDYRVQYWPSKAYRRQLTNDGNVNIAEDYTGESYLLAFHLGAIHSLRDSRYGGWSRFVDLAVGFETRGYKPDPLPNEPDFFHQQRLFVGVTLNAQGVFDYLLKRHAGRKVTHGLFEIFNVPYSTLSVGTERSSMTADNDGA